MEIVSLCPLRVDSLLWQPRAGAWVLTVVCKATYLLRPTESPLAQDQDAPNEEDGYWDDDASRSLSFASDLSPVKPRAEVTLVGHAFAPGKNPVRSLVARLMVGEVDKSIEAYCDRHFTLDGVLHEGPRFTRISLAYERAAGGPESWNPVGVRVGARDMYGKMVVPSLQPAGMLVSTPSDFVEPVGFGPIAPTWPTRRGKLGRHAGSFSVRDLASEVMPEGIDLGFFNAAPGDQHVQALRENERILLENLHPDHPRLVTSLPGVRPRAFVEGRASGPLPLPMRADTLAIYTDRAVCTMTWRGQLPLEHQEEKGRVIVALEQEAQSVSWIEVERATRAIRDGSATSRALESPNIPVSMQISGDTVSTIVTPLASDVPAVSALPFAAVSREERHEEIHAPRPTSGLPFVTPVESSLPSPATSAMTGPAAVSPPPLYIATPASVLPVLGGVAVVTASESLSTKDASEYGAVLDVSNAAAAKSSQWNMPRPEPRHAPAVEPVRVTAQLDSAFDVNEIIELIWLDRESIPKIRKKPAWRELIDTLESEPPDDELDDIKLGKNPGEIEDMRHIFEILACGDSVDGLGVNDALQRAIRKHGKFVPPLVLVSGELVLPFDELEVLKAHVAAMTPLSAGDEKLRATLAIARELLSTPELAIAPAVTEGLTGRLRDAFAQVKRAVAADYLQVQTEWVLLEKRRYQRRDVFGDTHIRCLLHASGVSSAIPVYLPDHLTKKLPLFQRFRTRMIAEVHLAVDQHETHPAALKAAALARAVERARK